MISDLNQQQTVLLSVVGAFVLLCNLGIAYRLHVVWRKHNRLLSTEPRWLVPWGLVDVIGAFLVMMFCGGMADAILRATTEFGTEERLNDHEMSVVAAFYFANALAGLVSAVLCVIAIRVRVGANGADFGLRRNSIRKDVIIGVSGFFAIVVPVLLLQLAAGWWMDTETQHPIVQSLRSSDGADLLWSASIFAAVIAAPIMEELLIRVILQGWLENIAYGRMNELEVLSGLHTRYRTEPVPPLPNFDDEMDVPGEKEEPEPAKHHWHKPKEVIWWPIVVSSAVFSLLHLSHGPDVVPLFFLAMGLGYIYHCTHRVLPCIIIHFLVNTLAIFILWVQIALAS